MYVTNENQVQIMINIIKNKQKIEWMDCQIQGKIILECFLTKNKFFPDVI